LDLQWHFDKKKLEEGHLTKLLKSRSISKNMPLIFLSKKYACNFLFIKLIWYVRGYLIYFFETSIMDKILFKSGVMWFIIVHIKVQRKWSMEGKGNRDQDMVNMDSIHSKKTICWRFWRDIFI
jgi:hypothetical protein